MSVKYISTVRLSPTTIRKTADLFQHKGRLQYQIGGKNGGQKQSSPTDDRKTVPEATVEGEVGAARPGRKNWRRLVRAGQSSRGGRAGAGAAKLGPRGLGRGVAACGGRAKPGDWAWVVVGGCVDARRGAHVAAEPLRRRAGGGSTHGGRRTPVAETEENGGALKLHHFWVAGRV
jgi:hypothetical protein